MSDEPKMKSIGTQITDKLRATTKMVHCETCNGTGMLVHVIDRHTANCWMCDGRGYVLKPANNKLTKESTANGALKAFKVIVDKFTPPEYTLRKSPNDRDQ